MSAGLSMPGWLQQPPWQPVRAPIANLRGFRGPVELRTVAAQFLVESAPRYRPTQSKTFCKTYLWDVLSALDCGAVAAHWVDEVTGQPCPVGMGVETRAWDTINRLALGYDGWRRVLPDIARECADKGWPTVVTHQVKPPASSHVALLLPGGGIAQAGAVNLFGKALVHGFGTKPVTYWMHE